MQELKVITIKLKDSEGAKKTSYKEPVHEDFQASSFDPVIQKAIDEAKKSFDGEPDSISWSVSCEAK